MKYSLLVILCFALLSSCSKESEQQESTLTACFSASKENFDAGEEIRLTNCSAFATSYSYSFDGGQTSNEESPVITFRNSGEQTISLTVQNGDGKSASFDITVMVNPAPPFEPNYFYPENSTGVSTLPLDAGINPTNGNFYHIGYEIDYSVSNSATFFYREFDSNYVANTVFLGNKDLNSGSGFVNFLSNGNKDLHFTRTSQSNYGSQIFTVDGQNELLNASDQSTKINYGSLQSTNSHLYHGTERQNAFYEASIEKRNTNGDVLEVLYFPFGGADSFIGDMKPTPNGYVAFGGVFNKSEDTPYIRDYKPLLVFFDTDLNATSNIIFEQSGFFDLPTSGNDLNDAYHIELLNNGNLAIYGNGGLIVTDGTGELLNSEKFQLFGPQTMVKLDDSFVLSIEDYLKKYDNDGNLIKELKYGGDYLPELVEKDGRLFFVAGYRTNDSLPNNDNQPVIKTFLGSIDKELNLVNLN